jgi:hypothetical protein
MAGGPRGDSWVLAPADVAGGGDIEWATVAGVPSGHPLLRGEGRAGGSPGVDVDRPRGLIVSTNVDPPRPGANMGGAADVFDDWRDLFDFRNSPVPYVVVGFLAMIGLVAFRVEARGGPANLRASLG